MSDSPENTNMESQGVPGWTLVNNQGEIMSGDEDSESSESSIEVVSLENNMVVSHRLQRERISEQADVGVTENSPSTEATSAEINFSLEDIAVTSKTESDEMIQKTFDLQEASLDSDFHETEAVISSASLAQTDSTLSDNLINQDLISDNTNHVFQEQMENCLGDGITVQTFPESESASACEMLTASCRTDFYQQREEINNGTVTADCLLQVKTDHNKELNSLAASENLHQISLSSELEESKRDEAKEVDSSACSMKSLLESEEIQLADTVGTTDANDQQIPAPVSFEEANISQISDEGVAESSHSSKSDSDADSDFVRLDTENIDGYVGQHQNNGERVAIPLKLFRTGSSIGPSFNFMRNNERNDNIPQNEISMEVVDQDRDDDTESSTEEGIDDRIESEQSETGSLSAQNDVGDLSVFADIGDLPLVAGDVPRNYIHRPNNHLSTVLNIIVVLVAILTMGISLGIIMDYLHTSSDTSMVLRSSPQFAAPPLHASGSTEDPSTQIHDLQSIGKELENGEATDLEIEEWQNAHEFQTRRVSQLEILLKSKTNAYELQLSRVKELEPQLIEIRNNIRLLEKRAKNYERAFDTLAAHSSLEGETFEKVLRTILDGVRVYVQCQEESNQLVAVDCHLKLLPYLRNYTALIKSDLSVDKTMNSNILLDKQSIDNVDVGISSHDTVTNAPILVSSSTDIDIDENQEPHNKDFFDHPRNTFENNTGNGNMEANNDESPSQKSDILQTSSENDRSEDKTSSPTKHFKPKVEQKTAKDTSRALPIAIDIRQLQQSLTREQERALHWQQLYLSERRQRERERENEEWEDEREREMAEREREQMDHVECLRKLMSANLTTLTQHVVKWNVSIFDDFANLSVLLSGISELQQAVVDSVQRVWKSAEEVIDSFQGKDSIREETTRENGVPKKEMIIEYLSNLADQVKNVDMPDHEVLVEYLGNMLDHVKHGVEDILHDVYTESVTDSVYKMWENAEHVVKDFTSHKETAAGDEKAGNPTMLDREHLLAYLSKVIDDICPKDRLTSKDPSIKLNKVIHDDDSLSPDVVNSLKDKEYEYKVFSGTSPTEPYLDTSSSGPRLEEEETSQNGFWSRKIGKMLKKTGKTVRKLGRKVTGTWNKIKTMWREQKPLWHKLKNMWHEKKTVFFHAGDKFASTVKKASKKFANMCTKMSTNWFKSRETIKVDIHNNCVQKLRQYWQKMVLKDPCHTVGKFSYECNSGKKQCRKDLNKMSDLFSKLLKIPNFTLDQVLKENINELKLYYKQFKSFQNRWGKQKLLLKTDVKWVDCQVTWWSAAVTASNLKSVDGLDENKCNTINLTDNFHDGQHKTMFHIDFSCDANNSKKTVDHNNENIDFQQNEVNNENHHVVEEDEEENSPKYEDKLEPSIFNVEEAEINETVSGDDSSSDWYHEQIQHRDHLRKEREKADWMFEQAKYREQLRNKHEIEVNENDHNKIHQSSWYFDRAKEREMKRVESGKSVWLFQQANHRKEQHKFHKKTAQRPDNWFMKRAEERQRIREEEHKSDWLFDRATNRKKYRDDKHKSRKQDARKPEQFRHVYGKVSTP